MIVVISSERDAHAMHVLDCLQRRGATATLLDLADFPQHLHLSLGFNGTSSPRHRLSGRAVDLDFSECRVIWWRRPQPFVVHEEVGSAVDRAFAYSEGDAAFGGLWLSVDAFWINHPTRDEEASRKVYQLKVAREAGLRVPRTCITNDPARAKEFIEQRGVEQTIYKAFAGSEQAWRETRLLKENELEMIESVRFAPVIFQEYVAGTDLRITVVGDEVFPAAIHVQPSSYQVDFRMVMDEARIEPAVLPPTLCDTLRSYMRRLGLVYGAIDMRRTEDGEYVFLEINPSGQWLFVEQSSGQPITETLATLMAERDLP